MISYFSSEEGEPECLISCHVSRVYQDQKDVGMYAICSLRLGRTTLLRVIERVILAIPTKESDLQLRPLCLKPPTLTDFHTIALV